MDIAQLSTTRSELPWLHFTLGATLAFLRRPGAAHKKISLETSVAFLSLYLSTRKSKGRDILESRPFAEDVHATCCGFCLAAPPRSAAAHVCTNIIRVYSVKTANLPIWSHLGRSTLRQRQRTGCRRGKVASAFRPGAASILDLRIGQLCTSTIQTVASPSFAKGKLPFFYICFNVVSPKILFVFRQKNAGINFCAIGVRNAPIKNLNVDAKAKQQTDIFNKAMNISLGVIVY